jgi:putative SOS response-associated peptidase YedK
MCSHYQGIKERERYRLHFGVEPPVDTKVDLWPGYLGSFVRRHPLADVGDEAVPGLEALPGLFGLVPHWATDTKIARNTYNARSETVAEKPSFRDAVKKQQRCIIPVEAIYETDWRSGKAVQARISSVDEDILGLAGLWSCWKSPKGEDLYSYTMLTINADSHTLMKQFHKPTDEKRMVVVLPPDHYESWLDASCPMVDFLQPYPADRLTATTYDTTKKPAPQTELPL